MESSTRGSWSETSVDDMAAITCQENYVLQGDSTLTCLDSGSWSGSVPTCEPGKSVCHGISILGYCSGLTSGK